MRRYFAIYLMLIFGLLGHSNAQAVEFSFHQLFLKLMPAASCNSGGGHSDLTVAFHWSGNNEGKKDSFYLCGHKPLIYTIDGELESRTIMEGEHYLYEIKPSAHAAKQSGQSLVEIHNGTDLNPHCSSISRQGIPHTLNYQSGAEFSTPVLSLNIGGVNHQLDEKGHYQAIVENLASLWSWCFSCIQPNTHDGGTHGSVYDRSKSPILQSSKPDEEKNAGDDPAPENGGGDEDNAAQSDLITEILSIISDPAQLQFFSHAFAHMYQQQPEFIQMFIQSQGVGLIMPQGPYGANTWVQLFSQIANQSNARELLEALISYFGEDSREVFWDAIGKTKLAMQLTSLGAQVAEAAQTIVSALDSMPSQITWFWSITPTLPMPGDAIEHNQQNWMTLLNWLAVNPDQIVSLFYDFPKETLEKITEAVEGISQSA